METGANGQWLANQRWSSQIRFFGFDPDAEAIKKAQARFPSWTLIAAPAYAIKALVDTADVIVSFSTLEHVYKRREFIQAARSIMLGSSEFYLNYDNGHFLGPGEWKRNIFGPALARLGVERYYQSFVWQGEVEAILKDCELQVVRELNFHQATRKEFQKVLADTSSNDTLHGCVAGFRVARSMPSWRPNGRRAARRTEQVSPLQVVHLALE